MDKQNRLDVYSADFIRHWSYQSQRNAGCDQLLTLMDNGWLIEGEISFDEYWHGGARRIVIYGFQMRRGAETVEIRVLGNPVANRLVNDTDNPLAPKRLLPTSQIQRRAIRH